MDGSDMTNSLEFQNLVLHIDFDTKIEEKKGLEDDDEEQGVPQIRDKELK